MEALEQATLAKVTRRLLPFLILCYFVAYLDRVNVSFAALTMNQDIGLSATAFGLGSGIFSSASPRSNCMNAMRPAISRPRPKTKFPRQAD
jgi:sugar phosphate permease